MQRSHFGLWLGRMSEVFDGAGVRREATVGVEALEPSLPPIVPGLASYPRTANCTVGPRTPDQLMPRSPLQYAVDEPSWSFHIVSLNPQPRDLRVLG